VEKPFGVGVAFAELARQGRQAPADDVEGPAALTSGVLNGQKGTQQLRVEVLNPIDHMGDPDATSFG
jgi:hypothetical protein